MGQAERITAHDEIRNWAEVRAGRPARVKGTGGKDGGEYLRFDLERHDAGLEPIQFFHIIEDNDLAPLDQDETAGGAVCRFSNFVNW